MIRAIDRYDTILPASPIWNVRAPMHAGLAVRGEKARLADADVDPWVREAGLAGG